MAIDWINIKDRLPEQDGEYLTFNSESGTIQTMQYESAYIDEVSPFGWWQPQYDNCTLGFVDNEFITSDKYDMNITHWAYINYPSDWEDDDTGDETNELKGVNQNEYCG